MSHFNTIIHTKSLRFAISSKITAKNTTKLDIMPNGFWKILP